jgi:hypothetical protein
MPSSETLPSIPDLVREMRGAVSGDVPAELRDLVEVAAQILSDLDPSIDLSERLSTKDDEQKFLSRVEALLPDFMTPQQITLISCFIMDRYGLGLPAVRAVLSASHTFMAQRIALKSMGDEDGTHQTRH